LALFFMWIVAADGIVINTGRLLFGAEWVIPAAISIGLTLGLLLTGVCRIVSPTAQFTALAIVGATHVAVFVYGSSAPTYALACVAVVVPFVVVAIVRSPIVTESPRSSGS
jgi:hypothetical protein